MWVINLLVGLALIGLGLPHIIAPRKVLKVLKKAYQHNPISRPGDYDATRFLFVRIFGVVWILVGLWVMLSPVWQFGH